MNAISKWKSTAKRKILQRTKQTKMGVGAVDMETKSYEDETIFQTSWGWSQCLMTRTIKQESLPWSKTRYYPICMTWSKIWIFRSILILEIWLTTFFLQIHVAKELCKKSGKKSILNVQNNVIFNVTSILTHPV